MQPAPDRSFRPAAFALRCTLVGFAAGSLVLAGCASSESAPAERGFLSSGYTAAVANNDAELSVLLGTDNEHVLEYHKHVVTLSNLFFEGRAPGTRGGEIAEEYLAFYFQRYGLLPAFDEEIPTPGGDVVVQKNASFRQPFTVAGDVVVTAAAASWRVGDVGRTLTPEQDFNVLGVSGNADVSGELAFVGYSISSGPDGYTSYPEGVNLEGKVAMVFRFEPMDEEGKSTWGSSGWSNYASLSPKLRAAAEKGAAAIILVTPPGVDDPRAGKLETAATTRIGGAMSIPVIMMTEDAADELVRAADTGGRTLHDLRVFADANGGVMEFPRVTVTIGAGLDRLRTPTNNVAAVLPGKGALADEYVVVGGHYDHLGYGHFGSRRGAAGAGIIHPGADDNASGTAGVLLLARALAAHYESLPDDADARSILFIGFGAEESGLNGSRHFVQNPPFDLTRVVAMLNMDMIGRLRDGKLSVGGVGTAEGFEQWLQPKFASSGFEIEAGRGGQGPSDHASFYNANVPVLFFFTGLHTEYHTPEDVASTVNYSGGAAIASFVGRIALALAQRPEPLVFASTGTQTRQGGLQGVSVQLGVAPGNYADDQPGVHVGGVTPGTSADDAGMKQGDRIVRWGGEELADVGAMMRRLSEHKPGDVVEIVVVRDGKEVPLMVTLKPRAGAR